MAIDQRTLVEELVFSGQGTTSELTADLERIAPIDAKLRGRARLVRWSALLVLLCMVILAFSVGMLFILLAIFLPVALLIYAAILSHHCVLQDRVSFLRLILKTIGEDAGKRGRIKVTLRLRDSRQKIREEPNSLKPGEKLTFYRDQWLTLDGRLADGTAIHESCVDFIRQRQRKNKNGKLKTKDRRSCLLRVQLDYDAAFYGDATAAAGKLPNPFRLPAGSAMKAANFTAKTLAMKTLVQGDLTPSALAKATEATLLGAYRILNFSRRMAAPAGGVQ